MFLDKSKAIATRGPATETLFRDAAVLFRAGARGGNPQIARPISTAALTAFIVAIAGALIVFVVRAEYSRKESVTGYLEPERGVIRIYPQRAGAISAVLVHEGQTVAEGAVLFKVAVPQTMADGSDADSKLLTGIDRQRAELTSARERELDRTEANRAAFVVRGAALQEQLTEFVQLEGLQVAQRRLADEQQQALRRLHDAGALPAMQWLTIRAEYLAKREKLQTTHELISRTKGELATLAATAASSRYESADRLAAIDAQLLALERSELEVESRRDFAVRAPIAGRVMALQRKIGELATPSQLVLTIIPENSPLVGRLLIPTRAIGFVTPGQRIQLRFDAFPYQHFGTHPGVLETVAASVLFNGDSFGPLLVNQPAYPATVVIPDQSIVADGRNVPLQSGMLLQADIILERRTILEWLARPLLTLRGRN